MEGEKLRVSNSKRGPHCLNPSSLWLQDNRWNRKAFQTKASTSTEAGTVQHHIQYTRHSWFMQQVLYFSVSLNVCAFIQSKFPLGAVETGERGSIHGALLFLFQHCQGKMQSERLRYCTGERASVLKPCSSKYHTDRLYRFPAIRYCLRETFNLVFLQWWILENYQWFILWPTI